LRADADGD